VDETCDNRCPDGWDDQYNSKSKSIVVVRVDLDIGSVPDADEETEGDFLALNDDDDNDNGTEDRLDGTVSGGDCDMASLFFGLSPSLSEGDVTLSATAGSNKIKVWENITKGTQVSLPKTWDLSTESLPTQYYVEGYACSTSLKDIELKLSYSRNSCSTSDKVKITVIDVDYTEDSSQTYGYDSYTNSFFPCKSVKVGDTDTVYADISGSSMAGEVYFNSSNTTYVTVSPSQASGTHQQVTFTGVAEGFAQGLADLHDPFTCLAANIGVYPYNQDSYDLAIRVVHEDDDVQDIPVGQGKPNQPAIAPGNNFFLDTTTTSGDDTIVVSNVWTGPDGICQTTAQGDDVQIILVGQGKPNTVCVSLGANGKQDTIISGNDDYFGSDISTGWDGICDTTADNTDDLSTDPYTSAVLQTYLNETIYNQAVVTWSVIKFSAKDWNFDLNRDGQLDVSTSGWTAEQLEIINNCDPPGSYDQVVFIVNNPDESWCGCCIPGQKYSFVFPDNSPDEKETTAHEIGHGKFSLPDLQPPGSNDDYNLMWHEHNAYKWRLRKNQWIQIQ